MLVSCNKEDGDGGAGTITSITAVVDNGSEYNATVDKVEAFIKVTAATGNTLEVSIAECPYKDGGFTMQLPDAIADESLSSEIFGEEGITLSNPAVKTNSISYFKATKNGKAVGGFSQASVTRTEEETETGTHVVSVTNSHVVYIYADGNTDVTGSSSLTIGPEMKRVYTYNLTLKKGWNAVYIDEISNTGGIAEFEIVNTVSADAKWHYDKYGFD